MMSKIITQPHFSVIPAGDLDTQLNSAEALLYAANAPPRLIQEKNVMQTY